MRADGELIDQQGPYTIRRFSGWYAVYKGRNKMSGDTLLLTNAVTIMHNFLRRDRQKLRPCMSCGTRFLSEGPHHRLCNGCRHVTATAEDVAV